jgi:hypothetical protein
MVREQAKGLDGQCRAGRQAAFGGRDGGKRAALADRSGKGQAAFAGRGGSKGDRAGDGNINSNGAVGKGERGGAQSKLAQRDSKAWSRLLLEEATRVP